MPFNSGKIGVFGPTAGAKEVSISRPQNRGAVSRRARNQIERKTIPNYCKLFNEFSESIRRSASSRLSK
jgi:hypothetical protein